MGDAAPADVGDVKQPVDAAQIDEGAEVGDVLDHALAQLVDLHLSQQLAALIAEGFLQQFAAGDDDVPAILVDLDDLDVELLADVVLHVAHRADIQLRTGQEGGEAFDIDHDAALDAVTHETLDNMAFAVFGGDPVPGLDRVGLLQAQLRHIVTVFDLFEIDVDLVADVRFIKLEKFRSGDETFRFVADIDERAVRPFCDNGTFDDLALVEGIGASGVLEQFIHRAREVREIQEAVRKFGFFCHVVVFLFCLLLTFLLLRYFAGTDPPWMQFQPDKFYNVSPTFRNYKQLQMFFNKFPVRRAAGRSPCRERKRRPLFPPAARVSYLRSKER